MVSMSRLRWRHRGKLGVGSILSVSESVVVCDRCGGTLGLAGTALITSRLGALLD